MKMKISEIGGSLVGAGEYEQFLSIVWALGIRIIGRIVSLCPFCKGGLCF